MTSESTKAKLSDASKHATVFDDKAEAGARAYAEAFLNLVARDGEADAALDELQQIVTDVFKAHPQFEQVATSPTVPVESRDRMLVALFEGRALPTVTKFLRVLNRHGRLSLLRQVAQSAQELWNIRQNRRTVLVTSAAPLDDSQQQRLRERLQGLVGATPVIELSTDPDLLGGMIVQVGDVVYDSSLRTQLARMRRRLVEEKLQTLRGTLAATATNT
jgi:F-type H+-transporting ATPase subunit delta